MDKPHPKTFNIAKTITISQELHDKIAAMAQRDRRTWAQMARILLENATARQGREGKS